MVALELEPRSTFLPLSRSMYQFIRLSVWRSTWSDAARVVIVGANVGVEVALSVRVARTEVNSRKLSICLSGCGLLRSFCCESELLTSVTALIRALSLSLSMARLRGVKSLCLFSIFHAVSRRRDHRGDYSPPWYGRRGRLYCVLANGRSNVDVHRARDERQHHRGSALPQILLRSGKDAPAHRTHAEAQYRVLAARANARARPRSHRICQGHPAGR